jgi:hypothetical protein
MTGRLCAAALLLTTAAFAQSGAECKDVTKPAPMTFCEVTLGERSTYSITSCDSTGCAVRTVKADEYTRRYLSAVQAEIDVIHAQERAIRGVQSERSVLTYGLLTSPVLTVPTLRTVVRDRHTPALYTVTLKK